jgi:hypothetical protein
MSKQFGIGYRPPTASFFQRPRVAVSELAASVEENLRSLLDKNYKLINEKKLKHFIESIQPLLESLKPLEKLGSGVKIEEKHIVQMLNYFLKMTMIH